jgi:hypothetical protein
VTHAYRCVPECEVVRECPAARCTEACGRLSCVRPDVVVVDGGTSEAIADPPCSEDHEYGKTRHTISKSYSASQRCRICRNRPHDNDSPPTRTVLTQCVPTEIAGLDWMIPPNAIPSTQMLNPGREFTYLRAGRAGRSGMAHVGITTTGERVSSDVDVAP